MKQPFLNDDEFFKSILVSEGGRLFKAKLENAPSLKTPKEFWDNAYSSIKKKNPKLSDESIRKIIGSLWYKKMSVGKKKETRKKEGKKYGKTPKE